METKISNNKRLKYFHSFFGIVHKDPLLLIFLNCSNTLLSPLFVFVLLITRQDKIFIYNALFTIL